MAHSDSPTGTPVSLVVSPRAATPGQTAPPPSTGPAHLPFSGFDLVPAVALAALLLALGTLLSSLRRPRRVHASRRPLEH